MNIDRLPYKRYPTKGILSTAKARDCSINYEWFLIRRVIFLEKIYLFCNPVSYQDEYRSGLRQSRCFSLVKKLNLVVSLFSGWILPPELTVFS